jgi:CheY-like chemotaxis protein
MIFMIIDDDEDDRFFFKEAITDMFSSAVCLEATDGVHALNHLQKAEQLPNFIFLDINMPRMDGKECLKELKKDATLKDIPVIMYSTYSSEKSIEEFRVLGSSHFLFKPTDMNKLPQQIREVIKIATKPS